MSIPKLAALSFVLPCLLASCIATAADLQRTADVFRAEIRAAEERTGEDLSRFDALPDQIDDLAAQQRALEDGALGATEVVGGGAASLILGLYAAYKKAKNDTHRERDQNRAMRGEKVKLEQST